MLLAASLQCFKPADEGLSVHSAGSELLLLSFFPFYETDEGKHAFRLRFLADRGGDWPFQIGLPYVCVSHVYRFRKRSRSPCSFGSNARHYVRKEPTRPLGPPRLLLSQLKEAGTYTVKCSLDSQDRLSKCVCETPHPFEMRGDLLEHGPLRDSETFSLFFPPVL